MAVPVRKCSLKTGEKGRKELMLEVKNISKTFNLGTVNEKQALRGLSLTLKDGDFVRWIH